MNRLSLAFRRTALQSHGTSVCMGRCMVALLPSAAPCPSMARDIQGPEWAYPGNCWGDDLATYAAHMVATHTMAADAEPLLWPGIKRKSELAILYPLSSQVWDEWASAPPGMTTRLLRRFILKRPFCQDRLETNIGKTQERNAFSYRQRQVPFPSCGRWEQIYRWKVRPAPS